MEVAARAVVVRAVVVREVAARAVVIRAVAARAVVIRAVAARTAAARAVAAPAVSFYKSNHVKDILTEPNPCTLPDREGQWTILDIRKTNGGRCDKFGRCVARTFCLYSAMHSSLQKVQLRGTLRQMPGVRVDRLHGQC